MSKIKRYWSDPVGSKLIAEIIKGIAIFLWPLIAIPIYTAIKSFISKTSFWGGLTQTWNSLISFFVTDFRINVFSVLLFLIAYLAVTFFIKRWIRSRTAYKIKNYHQDRIWNADIKWKWVKESGNWEIAYGDYSVSCPLCFHNLSFYNLNGQHHLKCNNSQCGFVSQVYHYQPPSNSIILMDMDTHYFHTALESTVKAQLRRQGIFI